MKIVEAIITPMPQDFFDPMPKVIAIFEDGSTKAIFEYDPDEVSFQPEEFIGLTQAEAHQRHHEKERLKAEC